MSDMQDFYKQLREEQKEKNKKSLETNVDKLIGFTSNYKKLTTYHYRLFDGKLDIFPTSQKYHCLITKKRGVFRDMEDFLLEYSIKHNLI